MTRIDDRLIKVGVEIGGQLKTYTGLRVAASGSKFANPLQNTATIVITNLSAADRNYLITETSPFNKNRKRKLIRLWAGRISTGAPLLFEGDITGCTPGQPPDISLTIKAKTSQFQKGEITAMTAPAVATLSSLAGRVAQEIGVELLFEAIDKNIGSFSFTGAKTKLVEMLAQAGRVDAYIDDAQLIVKDAGKPLKGIVHVLSAESGMIGIPEPTERGIKVRYLLNASSRVGARLDLRSVINPSATGSYTIFKLDFEVANYEEPFYYIAEGTRNV